MIASHPVIRNCQWWHCILWFMPFSYQLSYSSQRGNVKDCHPSPSTMSTRNKDRSSEVVPIHHPYQVQCPTVKVLWTRWDDQLPFSSISPRQKGHPYLQMVVDDNSSTESRCEGSVAKYNQLLNNMNSRSLVGSWFILLEPTWRHIDVWCHQQRISLSDTQMGNAWNMCRKFVDSAPYWCPPAGKAATYDYVTQHAIVPATCKSVSKPTPLLWYCSEAIHPICTT